MNPLINDTFIAPPCPREIELVYEDEHLLVINKPYGLLSLSGKNPVNKDSVHYRLLQQWPTALLIHRLDFGTSGLLVIALHKTIAADLNKQFQERGVTKHYEAVLYGLVKDSEGTIDAAIAKDPEHFPKMKICPEQGKKAQTKFQVLQRDSVLNKTKVRFIPLTGRTHQLRIHSAQMGHPILGCDIYGNSHSQLAADRLMLHASELTFTHPITGECLRFMRPSGF